MVMDGLRHQGVSPEFWGVGGAAMAGGGFQAVRPMGDFTVLGLGEALRAVPRLHRLADTLIEQILERRPDAILTIDNKGFAMRFARRLKKRMAASGWRAPILHLVAPTVWAWGGWRVKEVARSVDHLLCLFPFEAAYFTGRGVKVSVTGHPAAEREYPTRAEARAELGLGRGANALVLLPGSRRREVRSLLPDMLTAAAGVGERTDSLSVLLPAAETVREDVESIAGAAGLEGLRLYPASALRQVLAAGDYGLICSGTVTLEAALAGLPGSVYYRPDWVSRTLGGWLVDRGKVVLANAVSGVEVYPLHLNSEFTPESMARLAVEGLGKRPKAAGRPVADAVRVEGGFARNAAAAIMGELPGGA